MVGNDVVDLDDPETRPGATHRRFDARVFAACEQRALQGSDAPNRLRWMLWAAKEAAYKALRKLDAGIVFAPSRFVVELDPAGSGEVRHPDRSLPVRVESCAGCVHAVATSAGVERATLDTGVIVVHGTGPASPGEEVRREALARVAQLVGSGPAELSIAKEGRIPTVFRARRRLDLDLSLSHHGRYAAWACQISPLRRAPRE